VPHLDVWLKNVKYRPFLNSTFFITVSCLMWAEAYFMMMVGRSSIAFGINLASMAIVIGSVLFVGAYLLAWHDLSASAPVQSGVTLVLGSIVSLAIFSFMSDVWPPTPLRGSKILLFLMPLVTALLLRRHLVVNRTAILVGGLLFVRAIETAEGSQSSRRLAMAGIIGSVGVAMAVSGGLFLRASFKPNKTLDTKT